MKTNKLHVVLDTNVLIVSFMPHHKHFWLYEALENGDITLLISNEIIEEYYEKIAERYNPIIADMLTFGLSNLRNAKKIFPSIRWSLIMDDPDDDKFVDCAIAGNADMIVSNDKHFNILKEIPFPVVKVVKLSEFKGIIDSITKKAPPQ